MVFPCREEGSPPHLPDKDCNLKQRMSFCVPLSPSSSLSLCLSLCVCGNSDTAPSTEEGTLFFCALENCKWETPRSSIRDPKVGACEVLLPEQGPAQEEGQPEGESLHKIHSFRLPVPPSSRGLKASVFTLISLILTMSLCEAGGEFIRHGHRGLLSLPQTTARSEYRISR